MVFGEPRIVPSADGNAQQMHSPGEWLGRSGPPCRSRSFRLLPLEERVRLQNVAVVLVDDDPDVLCTLQVMLELYGLRVATARSAAEALQVIPGTCPDLVVSDISMPDMDGAQLLARLRTSEKKGGDRLPVVALSGDPPPPFSSQFDLFLSKPIAPEELAGAIAHVLGR